MKGRANDKIRTKLRGGWPKLIGQAFSTIVDSLSFYSYPRFTLHETYMARVVRSREIFQRQWPEAIYFLFSRGTIPWRGRRIALFFYFFFFLQGETSLSFRGRDFSRSTVAQFSKIRRDSLLPGMRTILRYRVITQLEVRPLVRKRGVLFLSLVDFWWTWGWIEDGISKLKCILY